MIVKKCTKFFIFFLKIHFVLCANSCNEHKTCGDCIKNPRVCAWCSKDDLARCGTLTELTKSGCDEKFIINPKTTSEEGTINSKLKTQIRPQQYKMNLRPGNTIEFNITYKEIENYPVDLYFLIDVSGSMTETRHSIAEKSEEIYKAMLNITNNVYLGMGSFCDKNTAPYKRMSPLQGEIYSFKNHMQMSNEFRRFRDVVSNVPPLTNYDRAEGGLDGLAQAMICDEIGWRPISRKIIIFITDELSHSAGEGKAAGIIQPYDGQCYTKNGTYEKELEMDYPSLSILNKLAIEKGITVIFTVKTDVQQHYAVLKQQIRGSRVVSFTRNKANVTFTDSKYFSTVLSDIYEEISSTIRLKSNEDRKHINLTFVPDCSTNRRSKNPECINGRGQEKIIKGYITLLRYYKKSITVEIGVEGMVEEKVSLNVQVPGCDCEENVALIEKQSKFCSSHGAKMCGICVCDKGWIGPRCGCTLATSPTTVDDSGCKPPGSPNDTLPCNGYGICHCGHCECSTNSGYEGTYCQCNKNIICPTKCSGHGDCDCDAGCFCQEGWTGEDCSCSTATCPLVNGKECNERGKCICNHCECQPPASWDARFEQDAACSLKPCPDCHDKQCHLLADCAICHINAERSTDCISTCNPGIHVLTTSTKQLDLQIKNLNSTNEVFVCDDVQANFGCYTRFIYRYDDLNNNYEVKITVQAETNCNQNYTVFGGIALVTLVVAGLLTLIVWKILTELQDRREYAKFMKAQAEASAPRDNPIFEPATTTFCNPAFEASK